MVVRHPRLLSATALLAVAGALLAFQPLRSPWWTGYDFDSVYVGSGLTLFRGDRSVFYDHPGAPLQEALAATFTGAWLLSDPGESRAAKADAWLSDLNRTRVYLRILGSFFYLVSALIVFVTVGWVFRSALLGLLGGLLFLGSPDVITWAAVVKPDPLLAALGVAAVGLAVEAYRRRSAALYLAAGFVLGYDVSVKVQAAALAAPLVLAALLRPPPHGSWRDLGSRSAAWLRTHRRPVAAAAMVWLTLVVALNALSAPPALRPLAELLAGLSALALVGAAVWRGARGTRGAPLVALGLGLVASVLAGMVVPNLFYASVPAPMLRQTAITLTGGGANVGAHPVLSPVDVLQPWRWLILFAALGLVKGLLARDRTVLLWAVGALATGFLAYLRYGELHYYASAIALLAPLVLEAFRLVPARPALVAVAVPAVAVAAILYKPYEGAIDAARGRGRAADSTLAVNRWVEQRLTPGQVALTRLESSDGRYFHLVDFYARDGPELSYRFLPPDSQGAAYVRNHHLRVAYVITGTEEDVPALLASLGLRGQARRVDAPGVVYRVGAS